MAISRLRRRRLSRNGEEETNAIGASDAWWSERDQIERAPKPKKRGRDAVESVTEPDQDQQVNHRFASMPGSGSADAGKPAASDNPWAWAFEILDLEPGCPWDDVRTRHKALAKSHHPDMVARLFPEAAAAAADEMTQINRAYGELKRIYRSRSTSERGPIDSAE